MLCIASQMITENVGLPAVSVTGVGTATIKINALAAGNAPNGTNKDVSSAPAL